MGEATHWVVPARTRGAESSVEIVRLLVAESGVFGCRPNSPLRKALRTGDRVACYAAKVGIVADACAATPAIERAHHAIPAPDVFRYVFELADVEFYPDDAVTLDAPLRRRLEAFSGRDAEANWSWLVQSA